MIYSRAGSIEDNICLTHAGTSLTLESPPSRIFLLKSRWGEICRRDITSCGDRCWIWRIDDDKIHKQHLSINIMPAVWSQSRTKDPPSYFTDGEKALFLERGFRLISGTFLVSGFVKTSDIAYWSSQDPNISPHEQVPGVIKGVEDQYDLIQRSSRECSLTNGVA